jgi:hypothetical protein
VKIQEILDYLSDYQLLEIDSVPWSQFNKLTVGYNQSYSESGFNYLFVNKTVKFTWKKRRMITESQLISTVFYKKRKGIGHADNVETNNDPRLITT